MKTLKWLRVPVNSPHRCLRVFLDTWTYHQLAGDLGDGHAEGEQVQAAVALKQQAG